uniref:Uncharacterized LOC107076177 n=1 Tax=Lepisosteus oculatus TaxID=7918 RepID=W5MPV0_LEPOC
MISQYIIILLCFEVENKYSSKSISQDDVVSQPHLTVSVQLGEEVTLECFFATEKVAQLFWLKNPIGETPICMASSSYNLVGTMSYGEFLNNERMKVTKDEGRFTLSFSSVQPSDEATYYCTAYFLNYMSFGNGTLLTLKENTSHLNVMSFVQKPVSIQFQTGDDVILQCTIHTETCAGDHSVYWFRHGSGESLPGLIYTHGIRSDQCERRSVARPPTRSCVYILPKKNLSLSDAGTYYCAVAICREILFGNGTLLEITGTDHHCIYLHTVVALVTTNIFSVIFIMVYIYKKRQFYEGGKTPIFNQVAESTSKDQQDSDTDKVNYAALNLTNSKTKTIRQWREMDTQVLYADVKCQQ